jgi:hypothetical protein
MKDPLGKRHWAAWAYRTVLETVPAELYALYGVQAPSRDGVCCLVGSGSINTQHMPVQVNR